MKTLTILASFALLSTLVACTAETQTSESEGGKSSPVKSEETHGLGATCTTLPAPSGGAVPGVANPAATYCVALGYELTDSTCAFGDGTSCEEWAFYRGECGQAHSFCNLHGGVVSNQTEDMGGWTASYARCTMPEGKSCEEQAFARTCSCE